ncbi:hypothetical protein [Sphingomonas sp.]|uniref:hypothetical protein n=1 Tax=Sphingomonas sp. TaxID=28214 RepID=UPI001E08D27B|nr:hypothetical protein [Sphingomonas sp.]MBX9797158.1 hypothetical protein [Sphingomonas sp.]
MARARTLQLPGIACSFAVAQAARDAGTRACLTIEPGHGSPAQTAPYAKRIEVDAGIVSLTLDHGSELLSKGAVRVIPQGRVHGFSAIGRDPARVTIETPDERYAALVCALAGLGPDASWRQVEAVFRAFGHQLVYE